MQLIRGNGACAALAGVLDEHLLHETVGVAAVRVVISLAFLAQISQVLETQRATGFPKSLECVLCLAGHHYVTNEPEEVALAGSVGQVSGGSNSRADGALENTCARRAELALVVLQHSLVVAHAGDISCAEIPEARILCLALMVFESLQEQVVLHYCVVYLGFKKIVTAVHGSSCWDGVVLGLLLRMARATLSR
jgi:hypothetical protein